MAKGNAATAAVGSTRTAAGRGWMAESKGEAAEARPRMADAQRRRTAVGREVVRSGGATEVPVLEINYVSAGGLWAELQLVNNRGEKLLGSHRFTGSYAI
ncbi:hypothetical protein SESBI_50929 [Sesbania bispinosa]|nr:hypothetical protein SESBI_50929 [Sesbania bispinosa]